MRIFSAVLCTIALAACTTAGNGTEATATIPRPPARELGTVTYYDRNHDGIVDYEYHDLGCCDRNWGLLDSDFSGRYDLELLWGYSFQKGPTDVAVPKDVPISDESSMPTWH
jgi:hypothetical protein